MKLNRILPPTLALASLLAGVLAGTAAGAATVSWYRFAPGCPVQTGDFTPPLHTQVTELRCGTLGRFFFGWPGLTYGGTCTPLQAGVEEPPLYPVETTAGSAAVPCQNGSCLGGGSPWAAVVDWNAPHGWTVAATLREASDARVSAELFDLASPGTSLPFWLSQVGDAHVLAQACAVAERAAAQPQNPPLAVNLSFGRLATKADEACATGAVHLSCAIADVLSHLRDQYGTAVVAAAGHHGLLLFPASAGGVIAAGSLNLAAWQQNGLVLPLPATPEGAGALMPGYGLYLSLPRGAVWAAPPGSSYASALTAGWIAGWTAGSTTVEVEVPASGRWEPVFDGQRYWLAHGGTPLPGSNLNGPKRLLERALGLHPEVCDTPVPAWDATVTLTEPAAGLPEITFPELEAALHGAQPGSHPCVPCHSGLLENVQPSHSVLLSLGTSDRFPEAHQIEGIYLQIGDVAFELDRSQDPQLLADFAAGRIHYLRIAGLQQVVSPGAALALVYALRLADGTAFRDQTPIHFHLH